MAARSLPPSGHLDGRPLYAAVVSLNALNAIAFCDISAAPTLLSALSGHFSGDEIVDFAPVVQLIGATIGQCVLGYFSNIWSRQVMLIFAVSILVVASFVNGLCWITSSPLVFVFARCLAGIATGSISNLVNIAQNDILPTDRRLKYQSIQGTSVAVGCILGSNVAAALIARWWIFYFAQMFASSLGLLLICVFIPPNVAIPTGPEVRKAMRTVDWLAIATFASTLLPGLLLLCKYSTFQQKTNIALGVVTAISMVTFGLVEAFKPVSRVQPLIPFTLFKNRTIAAIWGQNVSIGVAYYVFLFTWPAILVNVRHVGMSKAAAYMVPYFFVHAIWTSASAQAIRWLGRKRLPSYSLIFYFGYATWMLAVGLLAHDCTRSTHRGKAIIFFGTIVAFGTGSVFQNSVIAITEQTPDTHKAMAVSTRNVMRFNGGGLGTAITAAIMTSQLKARLPQHLKWMADMAIYRAPDGLSSQDQVLFEQAFAAGAQTVYYAVLGFLAFALILNLLVKDQPRDQPNGQLDDLERQGFNSVCSSLSARVSDRSSTIQQEDLEQSNGPKKSNNTSSDRSDSVLRSP